MFAQRKHFGKGYVCGWQVAPTARACHRCVAMSFRLKELRISRGWTQEQLAAMTGLSKGFVSQVESGARVPSNDTLVALSQAFSIEVPELYSTTSPGPSEEAELLALFRSAPDGVRRHLLAVMAAQLQIVAVATAESAPAVAASSAGKDVETPRSSTAPPKPNRPA